jgi:transposase
MVDQNIKHLYEVEKLSIRQIAIKLGISRKKVSRIIKNHSFVKPVKKTIISPYVRLINDWYENFPSMKATQVYERLKDYGFKGCYGVVKDFTSNLRKKKMPSFHELEFLPGEEAQVDWMQYNFPFGLIYGFVFILSFSRYLFFYFYPRYSMEFFLDGHINAFKEIGGIAKTIRYDNLKSVVSKRSPEIYFNPQFMDFATHYSFSPYICNPGRANEKGRVERVIRDIKELLSVTSFDNYNELINKSLLWRKNKNLKLHRSTKKIPLELLKEEKLSSLPQIHYKPYRLVQGVISKTGFVSFDSNRYSVPVYNSSCDILAYPDYIEIWIKNKKIASHKRVFDKNKKIEIPTHRQKLLQITPQFKLQRIYQLMLNLDKSVSIFLHNTSNPLDISYQLFLLLKENSKATFLSAIREAVNKNIFKINYLYSLLRPINPLYPQNPSILSISYLRRSLDDYDELI